MVFSIWVPDTFPTLATAKQILNANAITGLAALSIMIPLVGARLRPVVRLHDDAAPASSSPQLVTDGVPLGLAIALGLLVGVVIGVINARGRRREIDSFIATLATGSLIQALITMVTNDTPIIEREARRRLRQDRPDERSAASPCRSSTAVVAAGDLVPARAHRDRAAPVRHRLQPGRRAARRCARRPPALHARWSSRARSPAPPDRARVDPRQRLADGRHAYLLPAFAAAFLGATQLKNGRFNAWGTIIAVLLLGTGTTGLALADAPQWSQTCSSASC